MYLKRFAKILFAVVMVIFAVSGPCGAEAIVEKVPVPGHGYLLLEVPSGWVMTVNQPQNEVPPTIVFQPGDGKRFKLSVTALWNPKNEKGFAEDDLRRLIETDKNRMSAGAKETQIEIKRMDGKGAKGFYYSATDKAPKPGDYEHLTRAAVSVGNLLLSATLLSHPENTKDADLTIEMLRSASQADPIATGRGH